MQIQEFDLKTLTTVYTQLLPQEFHAAEVKPPEMVLRLYEQGLYRGYGLYDGSTLVGYAFFCTSADGKNRLLDYYVIRQEYRSAGHGGTFLTLLQKTLAAFNFLLIEVENPDYAADAADRQNRIRRIAFYERNGCRMTGIQSDLFGCQYNIMTLDLSAAPDAEQALHGLKNIYLTLLGKEGFARHVHLSQTAKKQ